MKNGTVHCPNALPHDSGGADLEGAETATSASSSNSVGSSVNVEDSIEDFMMPLDFLPSSDTNTAVMDLPSSEFDWSAALDASLSSEEGSDGRLPRRLRSNSRGFWSRHSRRPSRRRQCKI